LYRLSDSSGTVVFEPVGSPAFSSLSSSDAFLLDHSSDSTHPAIYVWIGDSASLAEQRLAVQYAQIYTYKNQADEARHIKPSVSLVKMKEGHESEAFMHAFTA
jgi:gelsolin